MAFKMKGSPMQRNYGIGSPINKNGDKSWEAETKQTEQEADLEKDDRIFDRYNQKRTERKAAKAKKADAKARAAMADFEAASPKTQAAQDAMSKKEAKKVEKLGKKAAKTSEKAKVKEAVASRQLAKKGRDTDRRPEKPKKEKFKAILTGGQRPRLDVGATVEHKIKDVKSGEAKARKARNKAAKADFKKERKEARQDYGLRGSVNVRRKAKNKDAI
jgi:hypothetical protein